MTANAYPEWWPCPGDMVMRDNPDPARLSADELIDVGTVLAVVPPGRCPGQEYLRVHMWYVMWFAREDRRTTFSFEPDHRVRRIYVGSDRNARNCLRFAKARIRGARERV